MPLRPVAVLCLVAGLAVAVLSPAAAHEVLVSSSPPAGARLYRAPVTLVLEFSAPVQAAFVAISVRGPAGTDVATGEPRVAGPVVTATVGALTQGAHEIVYRVVSGDGHPVAGRIPFTVAPAPPPTAPPPTTATPAPATPAPVPAAERGGGAGTAATGGSSLAVAAVVAGALLVVVGGALLAGRGRRGGDHGGGHPADTGTP